MSGNLAEDHFPLAVWVVRDMTRLLPHSDSGLFEDLISCASVALVEVATRYEPTEGAKFSTYAVKRIRGAVLDELRRHDWASRSVRDGRHRLAKAQAALSMELDRKPTDMELAERLGATVEELEQLRADVNRALIVQLDALVREDGQPLDIPGRDLSPEDHAIEREEHRHLRACVGALPAQHREVLARNFFGEESLTAIAADMGLTVARVSQIRTRGLLLLRSALDHIWHEQAPETAGGIRARNEEGAFVVRAVQRCKETAA